MTHARPTLGVSRPSAGVCFRFSLTRCPPPSSHQAPRRHEEGLLLCTPCNASVRQQHQQWPMSEQLSLSPPSLCRYAAALGKPRQSILEAQKSPFPPLRRGCVRLWFGGTKNRKTPSLIGTVKKQIVVGKSVFGEMRLEGGTPFRAFNCMVLAIKGSPPLWNQNSFSCSDCGGQTCV